MAKKANTNVEGLDIEFKKVGSFLYVTSYHLVSGKILFKCTGRPLNIGKREFVKIFDANLSHLDWTRDIENLSQKEWEPYLIAYEKCRKEIMDAAFN